MNEFTVEAKSFRCHADEISGLTVGCKNYNVHITEGTGSEIVINYHNNRFHKMDVKKSGSTIYLEEKMAVTFYGLFRFLELMKDNTLEIEIPRECSKLNISVETGVTTIDVREIHTENIHLISSTGQIYIRNIYIENKLSARSSAGKIFCQLPGTVSDYDVDCKVERKDIRQPIYPENGNAGKKILLRSRMYVPELTFFPKLIGI